MSQVIGQKTVWINVGDPIPKEAVYVKHRTEYYCGMTGEVEQLLFIVPVYRKAKSKIKPKKLKRTNR